MLPLQRYPVLFIILLLLCAFTLQVCTGKSTKTITTIEGGTPQDDDDSSSDDDDDDDTPDNPPDDDTDDDDVGDDDDVSEECCVFGDPCNLKNNGKCDCPENLWDWLDCLGADDDDDNDTDDDDDDITDPPDMPQPHFAQWQNCSLCHPGMHNGWYTPPAECLTCHSLGSDCAPPQGPQPPGNHQPPGPWCTISGCHPTMHNAMYDVDHSFCRVCHLFDEDCP